MTDYLKQMVEEFPQELEKERQVSAPWTDNLFKVTSTSPRLKQEQAEQIHTFKAKGLFKMKKAQQDIQPTIAFLYSSQGPYTRRLGQAEEDDETPRTNYRRLPHTKR